MTLTVRVMLALRLGMEKSNITNVTEKADPTAADVFTAHDLIPCWVYRYPAGFTHIAQIPHA